MIFGESGIASGLECAGKALRAEKMAYCAFCKELVQRENHFCPEFGKETPVDDVNRPSHYTQGKVECIDAIESALGKEGFIAFLRGQVIKYQWRLPHKGSAAKDAQKAKFYGDLLVERLKA